MNIGLDIHGVIDKYPEIFSELSHKWSRNHKIHIVTGQPREDCLSRLKEWDIVYEAFYSIVDYNTSLGVHTWKRDDREGLWMDDGIWVRSKGDYALHVNLGMHFDDTLAYGKYFPSRCLFLLVTDAIKDHLSVLSEL